MLGVCTGVLGWAPACFWSATTHELAAAFEARAQMLGQAPRPSPARLRRLIESRPYRARSIRPRAARWRRA